MRGILIVILNAAITKEPGSLMETNPLYGVLIRKKSVCSEIISVLCKQYDSLNCSIVSFKVLGHKIFTYRHNISMTVLYQRRMLCCNTGLTTYYHLGRQKDY